MSINTNSGLSDPLKSPELEASLISRLTFYWLTPLINLGYERPLNSNDIYHLKDNYKAKYISDQFHIQWNEQLKLEKPSIITCLYNIYFYDILLSGIMKLFGDGVNVFTPIILSWFIKYVADSQSINPPPEYLGYVYALAIFLSSITQTLFLNTYFITGRI